MWLIPPFRIETGAFRHFWDDMRDERIEDRFNLIQKIIHDDIKPNKTYNPDGSIDMEYNVTLGSILSVRIHIGSNGERKTFFVHDDTWRL